MIMSRIKRKETHQINCVFNYLLGIKSIIKTARENIVGKIQTTPFNKNTLERPMIWRRLISRVDLELQYFGSNAESVDVIFYTLLQFS